MALPQAKSALETVNPEQSYHTTAPGLPSPQSIKNNIILFAHSLRNLLHGTFSPMAVDSYFRQIVGFSIFCIVGLMYLILYMIIKYCCTKPMNNVKLIKGVVYITKTPEGEEEGRTASQTIAQRQSETQVARRSESKDRPRKDPSRHTEPLHDNRKSPITDRHQDQEISTAALETTKPIMKRPVTTSDEHSHSQTHVVTFDETLNSICESRLSQTSKVVRRQRQLTRSTGDLSIHSDRDRSRNGTVRNDTPLPKSENPNRVSQLTTAEVTDQVLKTLEKIMVEKEIEKDRTKALLQEQKRQPVAGALASRSRRRRRRMARSRSNDGGFGGLNTQWGKGGGGMSGWGGNQGWGKNRGGGAGGYRPR